MISCRKIGLTAALGIGLLHGFSAHGEPQPGPANITPHKTVRVPLLDRDPCEYPKISYCTQPTDVRIGRYRLRIPYNLIGDWPPGNNFIEIIPLWPKMTGIIKNGKGDIFDVIRIMINTLRSAKPTEDGILYYIQRDGLHPVRLPELGLLEYRQAKTNNAPLVYVPIEKEGLLSNNQPLFIQRAFWPDGNFSHAKPDPAKGGIEGTYVCSFGYTLRDGLYVNVEFYNRHLKDWKAITIAVRDLVESFILE